jgi:hypothetical protein
MLDLFTQRYKTIAAFVFYNKNVEMNVLSPIIPYMPGVNVPHANI